MSGQESGMQGWHSEDQCQCTHCQPPQGWQHQHLDRSYCSYDQANCAMDPEVW